MTSGAGALCCAPACISRHFREHARQHQVRVGRTPVCHLNLKCVHALHVIDLCKHSMRDLSDLQPSQKNAASTDGYLLSPPTVPSTAFPPPAYPYALAGGLQVSPCSLAHAAAVGGACRAHGHRAVKRNATTLLAHVEQQLIHSWAGAMQQIGFGCGQALAGALSTAHFLWSALTCWQLMEGPWYQCMSAVCEQAVEVTM